jgi:tetratricopeptide (TPR) repeat protein
MIKTRLRPARAVGHLVSPGFGRRLQLAMTLLVAVYMLLIGGTFDAGLRFRVQLLNTLAAGLIAVTWLAMRSRRGGLLARTGLEWPLALFALSQWLALLTSAQPRLGLEWAASVTAWGAALLILGDVLRQGWPRAYVLDALVLMATIVTAQGLAEVAAWYAGWLAASEWPAFTYRLNGMLGHANLTAAFLNLLLPLVIVRAAGAPGKVGRAAHWLLAAGMLATLFFTSSRAGWLSGGLGLATLGALVVFRPGGRTSLAHLYARGLAMWGGLPAAARWLAVFGTLIGAAMGVSLLAAQSRHITHGPLFSSRDVFWRVAWQMFATQPLTGAGPDLFPWFYTRWVPSPPNWFAPHAHSLILQVLSGSGLMGVAALMALAGAAARQLWRRWRGYGDALLVAGISAGLAGFGFQHLFDYLLGSPLIVFVCVVLLALALSDGAPAPARRGLSPLALAPWVAVPLAVAVFALRGAGLNDQGLLLAAQGEWRAAAQSFERAATRDPGLTLYWQHAAYAYTLAGEVEAALPLWRRAAQDDPYWPVLPATVGVLTGNREQVQAASALASSHSHLFALNEGVLAEAAGDLPAASAAYAHALDLRPTSAAALFWQQTVTRQSALAAWQGARSFESSPLALGQQALAAGNPQESLSHLETALAQNPLELAAYVGLAQAYQALGDEARAEQYRLAASRVPVTTLEQTLDLRLLAGDWARARGDLAAAAAAYGQVFSAINDYTAFGPGTYGYPQRSWYVFRRQALPADLVPQLARADITAALDERFAWLAGWFVDQDEPATACLIVERVRREAAQSKSAAVYDSLCR